MASEKNIEKLAEHLYYSAEGEAEASGFWTPRMVLERNLDDTEGYSEIDHDVVMLDLDPDDFTHEEYAQALDIAIARTPPRDTNPTGLSSQRFVKSFAAMQPWAMVIHGTVMGDDLVTFMFAPVQGSRSLSSTGLPRSHKGFKYLQREIAKRAAWEGLYLVPVKVDTDHEQTDLGVGERGDVAAAKGRAFLTFRIVPTEAQWAREYMAWLPERERHPRQRRQPMRAMNPGAPSSGDLVSRLRF